MILSTKTKIFLARRAADLLMLARKICGLSSQTNVTRHGIKWLLDLREGIDFAIYLTGAFEPKTISSYQKLLNSGDVAIDIGANIGAHTLPLAEAVGSDGLVIAFEPTEDIYAKLQENLLQNPDLRARVKTFQTMLMSEDNVEIPAEIHARWPLDRPQNAHPLHFGVPISTNGATAKSLDSVLAGLNIEKVKLIKLDVDGYELDVLKGAKSTIEQFKPSIIFEHSPYTSVERNIEPSACVDFLSNLNYMFSSLSGKTYGNQWKNLPALKPGYGINILAKPKAE